MDFIVCDTDITERDRAEDITEVTLTTNSSCRKTTNGSATSTTGEQTGHLELQTNVQESSLHNRIDLTIDDSDDM